MTKIRTKMNKKQRDFSINATSGIWQSALLKKISTASLFLQCTIKA